MTQSNVPRFTPQPPIFERIGGRETVRAIIEDFYARVEADSVLRPLFPEDLRDGIERQQLFMEQWLGGAPLFSISRGQPMLRRRHFPFVIGPEHAARWLAHMRAAFEAHVAAQFVDEVMSRLEPLAHHMVNEGQDVPRDPLPS